MIGNTMQIGASGTTQNDDDVYEGLRVSPVATELRAHWPVFLLFLAGLISVGLYIGAIALRWIDWAQWSPVALAAAFVAWASAIRVKLIAKR
jgi:hypothetical protein